MASRAEQVLSRSLRAVLAGLPVGAFVPDTVPLWGEVSFGLGYFLPEVLREIHPEWEHVGLDGVLTVSDRKSGDGEIELLGLCLILGPSPLGYLAPVHLRLRLAPAADEVAWLECRVGERREGRWVRTPSASLHAAMKRLRRLEGRVDRIDWFYHVGFGERRPPGERIDPRWLTATVLALARGISADRAFDRLPILADALEDAGCDAADILEHCRGDGPHVRGCWVVDQVLGMT